MKKLHSMHSTVLLACLFVAVLSGCESDEHEDLKQWMNEQAKDMRGKVAKLPEIKPFPPVAYEAGSLISPFSPAKIVTLDSAADKSAPNRNHAPQPLESFPLEDLKVVGVILSGNTPYALIQTPPPNKPKSARVGEFIGQNFGHITAITKDGITVRETVKDINGEWVEQEKTLAVPKVGVSQ
jgi:type IV pilus assembly protein PilP